MVDLLARADKPAIVRELGSAGWVAPQWASDEGGRGLTVQEAAAALKYLDLREVPRVPRGAGLQLAAPTIARWSEPSVRRRFLPSIASGREQWCQLFSEPGAGSDLASLATTAVRDRDEWVVNGQKVWTTMGQHADFGMLLARTDPTVSKHAGITYFGVDMHAAGVEVRPLVNIAGEHEFNEVFLTDVRIPDAHRITPVGEGWGGALTTLSAERGALSGTRKKRRPKDEILGGRTFPQVLDLAQRLGLTSAPVIRDRLVREWMRGRVLQLTTMRARADSASGKDASASTSITKLAKAESNQSLQLLAIELLGARATAWDPSADDPLEAHNCVSQMLRTRANSIEGGTSEIQRNIVAERILGLPREPDSFRGVPWNQIPRS
jgi:alkylation response protein AidB-like acyl-CoA dehydrogenase